jgi:serine O-acetyltransferase
MAASRIVTLAAPVASTFKNLSRAIAYAPLRPALALGGESAARDVRRQLQPRLDLALPDSYTGAELVSVLAHRPFRTILYHRLKLAGGARRVVAEVLSRLYRGEPALFLNCSEIGAGLMMMHGFATIVTARAIGVDCQIAQQVTVGYDDRGGSPALGDRVRIGAGAIVLGPIEIGDDAVIGAGAVVVRDVPAGKVVAGVPAQVIERAADRFSALRRGGGDPV